MNKFALCLTLLSICGAISARNIVGGKTAITDKHQFDQLVGKVNNYLGKINEKYDVQLELFRPLSATVQVVSGVSYEMLAEIKENNEPVDCKISLWEQSWMNFVRMNVECGPEKRMYSYESGKPSSLINFPVVGGFRDMTPAELNRLEPKLFAVFKQNNFFLWSPSIISGKEQVVAGRNYIVQVRYWEVPEFARRCEVKIFENLKGELEQVDAECLGGKTFHYDQTTGTQKEISLPIPGGFRDMTPAELNRLEPKLENIFWDLDLTKGFKYWLRHVVSGKQQVVAGMHYIVQVDASGRDFSKLIRCEADIYENLKGEVETAEIKCEGKTFHYPTENFAIDAEISLPIPGGFRDMTSTELKHLEPKLTDIFYRLDTFKKDFHYWLRSIVSGKQQVVAGMHYIVEVDARDYDPNHIIRCEADIFENLNGEFEEVEITCEGKTFHYPIESVAIDAEVSLPTPTGLEAIWSPELREIFERMEASKKAFYRWLKRLVSGKQQSVAGMIRLPVLGGYRDMKPAELKALEPKLFAVFEQNNFHLWAPRIASGKKQVVAGMNYIVQVHYWEVPEFARSCEVKIFENLKGEFEQVDANCSGGKTFHYTQQ